MPSNPQFYLPPNVVDLDTASDDSMYSWAELQLHEGTENSFIKHHERQEIELSCNSARLHK